MKIIDDRIEELKSEKVRILSEYRDASDDIRTMLAAMNMQIELEMKFLLTLQAMKLFELPGRLVIKLNDKGEYIVEEGNEELFNAGNKKENALQWIYQNSNCYRR